MDYPRLVIAGVQSGVGKTTLSLGLMRALCNRGLTVRPFKVGPDYIDPGLHYQACGFKSHNLDTWMGTEEVVKSIFVKNAAGADIAIIEGVMGLYDGVKNRRIEGSTAELAMLLDVPLILVVNVQGMAQSCVALIKGFMDYEPQLKLRAVVLNNSGEYHKTVLKNRLEKELGIKVLGCLPRQEEVKMPSRHLGLMPAEENHIIQTSIARMAELIESNIDLEAIMQLAQTAGALNSTEQSSFQLDKNSQETGQQIVLGVARDAAFTFYYQDSLDYLAELGAKIVYFSPLKDEALPNVDGLYLGGGFPEMFLPQLAANQSMLRSIREAHKQAMPIYAECGGLLYLSERIMDFDNRLWPGAGIVAASASMSKSLKGLGYVEAILVQDTILGRKDDVLRGHEFHYSTVSGLTAQHSAYLLNGGKGEDGRLDGFVQDNLLASYVHLHLRSNPAAAANFLATCAAFKRLKRRDSPADIAGSQIYE